jgi:RNA polymerase sigma-70 factor, ECF subfamily
MIPLGPGGIVLVSIVFQLPAGAAVLMVDGDPDEALVARCLQGEIEAFEAIVSRYQRVLFNAAYRLLGDREEARDAAQAAFVKAYEKLATFDPHYRFFSWIYRIVVNEALNTRERRRPSAPLLVDLPDVARIEEELAARERSDSVQAALLRLSAEDREVIVLRHFAELSYAEIGETLGLAEKTVKSRLHEARQRLGRMLGPESPR